MDRERYERGLQIRREVLGAEYVDRALANRDDLTMEFQELVTEYCWGAIWGSDDLPRQTRSLLNLGMLAALGRVEELKLHIVGAVRNGCTRSEIRAALLQVTIYCGVPAGVEAFRAAREALATVDMPDADAPADADGAPDASRLDAGDVTRLAAQARLPLADQDVDAHVARLEEFAAWVDEWADERLPFRFENGNFSYAPMLAQYRPEWRGDDER